MANAIRLNISNPNLPGLLKFGLECTNEEGVAADFYLAVTVNGTSVVAETKVADNVANSAAWTNYLIALPLDSSTGLVLSGSYGFTIKAKQVGTSTVISTYTETCGVLPYSGFVTTALSLTESIDCVNGSFTVTDETPFTESSILPGVTRYWTITEPSVLGSGTSQITGSNSFVKVFFNWVNVSYSIYLRVDFSYDIASGGDITVTQAHQLTKDYAYFVDCDNNLCEIKQCLYDTLASLSTAACRLGGFDKMNASDRAKWFDLQHYLAGWQVANECMDAVSRQAYYLKLKSLLNCECDEDTDVRAFILPDGSEQVQTAWSQVPVLSAPGFTHTATPLRWRIDKDNNLQIIGRMLIPNGLTPSDFFTIVTGVFPSARIANILSTQKHPLYGASGNVPLMMTFSTNTDIVVHVTNEYIGTESVYVNIITPLDAVI